MYRKPLCVTTESTKDEWSTKEGTSESIKNALHIQHCGMPKGTFQAEMTSIRQKIKFVSLVVIKLCWHQAGRQFVSHDQLQLLKVSQSFAMTDDYSSLIMLTMLYLFSLSNIIVQPIIMNHDNGFIIGTAHVFFAIEHTPKTCIHELITSL